MNNPSSENNQPMSVSLGRQPIFDTKRRLWGYALFSVDNSAEERLGSYPKFQNVAFHVASSTYIGVQQFMQQGKKVLVGFNEKHIFDELPYAFPPHLAAITISENSLDNPQMVSALKSFQADGYLMAIDDFTGRPEFHELYASADILCLDTDKGDFADLKKRLSSAMATKKAALLAKSIHDAEYFDKCQELGFSLFHGSFFKSPEIFTDRQVSSSEISRFNLFKAIEQQDPDMEELAKVIQADVSISFRLLSYLNSAAFGFSQNIESVHKAITLLGWKTLKKWLRVIVLSDMGKDADANDLIFLSAQRGRFMESIATDHDYWGFNPDSLFLLGTFSLLDTLLGIPMADIVNHLPVESKIKSALCRETNNEYLPLLELAQCLEETRWQEGETLIQKLNLSPPRVKQALQASVDWANELAAFQV